MRIALPADVGLSYLDPYIATPSVSNEGKFHQNQISLAPMDFKLSSVHHFQPTPNTQPLWTHTDAISITHLCCCLRPHRCLLLQSALLSARQVCPSMLHLVQCQPINTMYNAPCFVQSRTRRWYEPYALPVAFDGSLPSFLVKFLGPAWELFPLYQNIRCFSISLFIRI